MKRSTKRMLVNMVVTPLLVGSILLGSGFAIGRVTGHNKGFSDAKKDRTIINQTLNRGEMFKDGEGLPADYWIPGWGNYPGFINEQKNILRDICLYGEYSKFDTNYVSPERANELLKLYGWEDE